jgi:hypothetical protein
MPAAVEGRMALTTLNLAAIPIKFVAIPALAGLAAGTGAFAAYVTAPSPAAKETAQVVAALPGVPSTAPLASEQSEPAKPKKKSCEEQTWPYIENRCIVRQGNEPNRQVRLVMAPREGEAGLPGASASGKAMPPLVTSDGVLRGPGVAPEADEPAARNAKPGRKSVKRSEVRRQRGDEFRRVYSVYSVPSAESTKPVIVVRPLQVNQYSSRF